MVFSWVFELTPEGLRKETEVDRTTSITPQTGKKLDRMIMVVLALAVAYFAFDKFVLDPGRDASEIQSARQEGRSEALVESYGDHSIAVLPFVNMSADEDQAYFSDGISEELLNLLAKVPQLRVTSRRSSFAFRGQEVNVSDVAKTLNVAHILEGSVRKAGSQVRITVQLVEALSDTNLWSETYDRQLDDIFAIQDEIAAAVVDQLKIELLGTAPKSQEVNAEAYALYLQGRHLGRVHTPEAWQQSSELYERAIALDPQYAAPWADKAVNLSNQAGIEQIPAQEGYDLAVEAAMQALAIDPDYAKAHVTLAWVAMAHNADFATAARHLERALQLDPSDLSIISNTATLLLYLGRFDEAIRLREFAMARDPVNAVGWFNLGATYLADDRPGDAITALQSTLRLSPKFSQVHIYLARAYLLQGEYQAALDISQQAPFDYHRLIGQALAHYSLGQRKQSDAALAELIDKHADRRAWDIASVLAWRNEPDEAFKWLDIAVQADEPAVIDTSYEVLLANLHDDPRWSPLLERLGQTSGDKAAIAIEVALPE